MDEDLRQRYLVHIRTRVFTTDLTRYFDGVIRNISLHGALVSTEDAATLPNVIYLRPLEAIGPGLIECEVRWRRVDRLFGVRFCEPAGLMQVANMLAQLRSARSGRTFSPLPGEAPGTPDDIGNAGDPAAYADTSPPFTDGPRR